MLKKEMMDIIVSSKRIGWIMEPQAKQFFSLAGLAVPRSVWTTRLEDALRFAKEVHYPVVGKVVSPKVIHKSERDGVAVGIGGEERLKEVFDRFGKIEGFAGILVEEMVTGLELIVGAKIDCQFGPVILLGIGGTAVEIYQDVALRMAPLRQRDVASMIRSLKAYPLLKGYRGSKPVNVEELSRFLMTFSAAVMDLEEFFESIDLNPVICSPTQCLVADARIILRERAEPDK
jgi:acyl-CoA synthetase (NDP forming)